MTDRAGSEQFAETGFRGPLRVLSKDECRRFLFSRAGEAHGMRSVGIDAARYVVFELHGRTSLASAVPGRVRTTFEELVTPRHWKRRLKSILGR